MRESDFLPQAVHRKGGTGGCTGGAARGPAVVAVAFVASQSHTPVSPPFSSVSAPPGRTSALAARGSAAPAVCARIGSHFAAAVARGSAPDAPAARASAPPFRTAIRASRLPSFRAAALDVEGGGSEGG
mmetsp:Transcript_39593/g.128767  ORF Transcript_39593/g.128767 Transcript_39593/m.128767 type:complete len:129 (-) Transcript_39593:612-998(-)